MNTNAHLHQDFIDNGHNLVTLAGGKDIYDPPIYGCPYCGFPCSADYVDVGVGMQQCGPYFCQACKACQHHPEDSEPTDDAGIITGWHLPGAPISRHNNTVDGILVGHREAKAAYNRGRLDEKPPAHQHVDSLPF